MYIDMAAHILTPKFADRYCKLVPAIAERIEMRTPAVADLEIRMRLMSRYPQVLQVLTMANLPLERYVESAADAVELAKIGNEELGDIVLKYPDKFMGAAAILPMNDVDAACKEAERAIKEYDLQGIQLYTRINGTPVADKKFRQLFKLMDDLNLPIWIHPTLNPQLDPDNDMFTWEFELTSCMHKLVMEGIFKEFPDIKIIIHHAGAMVPFYRGRVHYTLNLYPLPYKGLSQDFHKFYVDTAIYGNTTGLMDCYTFFGADHMLFGTDAPLGPKWGMIEGTLESIDRMDIPEEEKQLIYKHNALNMFNMVL
ncbi:MAG: amidohydrolase family protein [Clostridiales Family XIII bacterium]|jgi:predicted TIM-barrel fold metal-dependent hydrolase|nr:amidohydrolase family protein [Clostridiales Family XIII bacterium]